MCRTCVLEFFIEEMRKEEFTNKQVLEIGSKYVNGSVRPIIEKFFCPKIYVGVDIESGKYVDRIVDVGDLVSHFGLNSFDAVIAAEFMEHVNDWRRAIRNIKEVLKPDGCIYITTVSVGFPFHGYPYDFWRFDIDDMKNIFSDFDIISLREDPDNQGIYVKCRKPYDWKPTNLEGISLYSMVLGRKITDVPRITDMPLTRKARFGALRLGKRVLQFVHAWLEPGM